MDGESADYGLAASLRSDFDDGAHRADISQIVQLNARVDHAALLLIEAFARSGVDDFKPQSPKITPMAVRSCADWRRALIEQSLLRLRDVRNAVVHDWTPNAEAESYFGRAFLVLTELTPARRQLQDLFHTNRASAVDTLDAYLGIYDAQVRLTARLVDGQPDDGAPRSGNLDHCGAKRDALLARAGDLLSLSDAAVLMDVSRQALHQRIQKGRVLAILRSGELVLPAFQFVAGDDGRKQVLPGLHLALAPFFATKTPQLSALRFLIEHESHLETTPVAALHDGRVDEVGEAARRVAEGLRA